MKLIFTRHGESEANRLRIISNRDLPHALTEAGRCQAYELAEKLRDRTLERVYASPLLRACQTGEILSAELGVPLELADGLREPDCGLLEGRGDEKAWQEHRYWMETWLSGREQDCGPEGGETCIDFRRRFSGFIKQLVEIYGASPAEFVLVTHGEALLFGLPGLVKGLAPQYLLEHGLGHAGLLNVDCVDGELLFRGI